MSLEPAPVPLAANYVDETAAVSEATVHLGSCLATLYAIPGTNRGKAVLLLHGSTGDRNGLRILARRICMAGYVCLSPDLPSHGTNRLPFTYGAFAETTMEAMEWLVRVQGFKSVSLVGHSIGAVGALLSQLGYTQDVEQRIFTQYSTLLTLLEGVAHLPPESPEHAAALEYVAHEYSSFKQTILGGLKKAMPGVQATKCLVLLAPPRSLKEVVPGLPVIRALPKAVAKHLLQLKQSDGTYRKQIGALYTDDFYAFLDYVLATKDPDDYIQLIESIAALEANNSSPTFIARYYQNYLLAKPKLFVYGNDILLRPWFGREVALEKFYRSCGNATIVRNNLSHVMMENPLQQDAHYAIGNDDVAKLVIAFLNQ